MRSFLITTGTVTYAIKGRDLLRKKGFKAKIEKTSSGNANVGCGYAIALEGDLDSAEKILKEAGIKILEIREI